MRMGGWCGWWVCRVKAPGQGSGGGGGLRATLVLTAMGTALGGPSGGAIGAVLGQGFYQNVLFKPKGREGPRISELDVQTSTYGSQVPQMFGRMRGTGTVIWATDLNEHKQKSGGGKGRPSVPSDS